MNVFICDDHRLFADALASVLRAQGWEVLGIAQDPARAIAALLDNDVDVCLMDLMFPGGVDGTASLGELRRAAPGTKIVVITASADPSMLARAAQAGVAAIVFKDDAVSDILAVIARAQAGGSRRDRAPRVAPATAQATARSAQHELARFLTPRERETLERLVHGETGTELAANMGINYATTRTHVQNVLTKLGVHSRLEAVAFAVSNSLVSTENMAPERDPAG